LNYRFLIADDALATFEKCSRREITLLLDHCRRLGMFPEDYDRKRSVCGFDYYSKRIGRWSFTYQIDSPVKKILVVAIEKLPTR
jgi:hypothetical protein